MKKPMMFSCLAVAGIIGFAGLGATSHISAQNTTAELSDDVKVVQALTALKNAGGELQTSAVPSSEINELVDAQLAQLPASAQELASDENTDSASINGAKDLKSALSHTSQTIYEQALQSSDSRAQELQISDAVWDFAKDHQLADGAPTFLNKTESTCSTTSGNAKPRPDAPESVSAWAESADAYLYAAQVISARASQDSLSRSDARAVSAHEDQAQEWESDITHSLSCSYRVPAQKAAYAFNEQDAVNSLNQLESQVVTNAQAVLADSSVPSDSTVVAQASNILFSR